ncbi:MAG: Sua5/YciO/YrdC/YwlC family protein [Pseudomonadota bacterium]
MTPAFIIGEAARIVRHGGVIAHPTEGVYGLACDPEQRQALERIFAIKSRDLGKGVILLAHDAATLQPYCAPFDDDMIGRLNGQHRRPVTFVVPAAAHTSALLTGGRTTLAVRVTRHPLSRQLCRAVERPIVSTSANRGGRRPARSAQAVRRALGGDVDMILAGPLGGASGPSEIRDALTGNVLRPAVAQQESP